MSCTPSVVQLQAVGSESRTNWTSIRIRCHFTRLPIFRICSPPSSRRLRKNSCGIDWIYRLPRPSHLPSINRCRELANVFQQSVRNYDEHSVVSKPRLHQGLSNHKTPRNCTCPPMSSLKAVAEALVKKCDNLVVSKTLAEQKPKMFHEIFEAQRMVTHPRRGLRTIETHQHAPNSVIFAPGPRQSSSTSSSCVWILS